MALLLAGATAAQATVLNFDSLPGDSVAIPNGYGGLNWSNFYYLNAASYSGNPSGYLAGMVSPNNVAYNAFGDPASFSSATTLTLNSAYFTGAWNDNLSITAKGYNGANLVDSLIFTVSSTAPTLEVFNWSGIDSVVLSSSGGTPHGYPEGSGEHFAMDDLTINGGQQAVPEPSSVLIWGVAAVGLAAFARRGRRGTA
ncbi:MAG: hypothetical protein ABR915_12815 [Thermoguttaceae bacterium]